MVTVYAFIGGWMGGGRSSSFGSVTTMILPIEDFQSPASQGPRRFTGRGMQLVSKVECGVDPIRDIALPIALGEICSLQGFLLEGHKVSEDGSA